MVVRVRVDTSDMARVAREFPEAAHRAVRRLVPFLGQEAVAFIKRFARAEFKYAKGPLAASTRATILRPTALEAGPHVPYAEWVNDGTRAHEITPRNASALRIPNRGAGGRPGYILRRRVMHPGFRGHHYIEATAEHISTIAPAIAEAIIAREVARGA